jgi:hypothetical protein
MFKDIIDHRVTVTYQHVTNRKNSDEYKPITMIKREKKENDTHTDKRRYRSYLNKITLR